MRINDIVIKDRYRKKLGDIGRLAKSIANVGLLHPVVVGSDDVLIAGERRLAACHLLGWDEVLVTVIDLDNPFDAQIAENVERLNLLPTEMVAAGKALEEKERAEAKGRQGTRTDLGLSGKLPESKAGQTRDKVARAVGVSGRTYEKATKVVDAAQEQPDVFGDLPARMDKTGKVGGAYRELRRREREQQVPKSIPSATKSPTLIVGRAEHMPQIGDESVDLIITSPPYNLGSQNWPMGGDGRAPRENGIGYEDELSENDYQEWQLNCLIEMYRVAKPGASLFYNHKVRSHDGEIIHPMDWLRDERNPWIIRQEIVWDRGSTHNHCATLFWPHDERVYWMTKSSPTLPDRSIGLSTVWQFHGPKIDTWHPAPFAEELPRKCIEALGRDGITVLDPFAGSCTTLKVALEYNYDAIGVDVSSEYLTHAREENGWIINGNIEQKVPRLTTNSS